MSVAAIQPSAESNSISLTNKKIFFIANALETDAPTRLLAEVARGATKVGAECFFVAWRRAGKLVHELTEFLSHPPVLLGGGQNANALAAALQLRDLVQQYQPHIVHAILTRPGLLSPPIVKASSSAKVIVTQHGLHEWAEGPVPEFLVRWGFKFSSRFVDRIVAVSRPVENGLRQVLAAHHDKLCTIYNGVDTERFAPALRAERAKVLRRLFPNCDPAEIFLVGAAGNLRRIKGYDHLVRAAAELRSRPHFRFVLWGEGPERRYLEEAIQECGLKDRFRLAGATEQLPECLAACDCFVQPSRSESFGLAAAEAMACGVPIVASRVGGLQEVVLDGVTGFLFPPESPHALALHLQFLADHEDLRSAMGAAARRRVCEHFSLERMVQEYLHLYTRLCYEA